MVRLLERIELHLERTGAAPTMFSREATNDPRFVFDLRNGREPRPETAARVNAWLDRAESSCAR